MLLDDTRTVAKFIWVSQPSGCDRACQARTSAGLQCHNRVPTMPVFGRLGRVGDAGRAFTVVAAEMSALTGRTKLATDEIGARAAGIARDIGVAEEVVAAHEALAAEQDELLLASLDQAQRQREAAAELVTITTDTVDTVDRTAAAIGRVGANAVAAKMLARQLAKLGRACSDGRTAK